MVVYFNLVVRSPTDRLVDGRLRVGLLTTLKREHRRPYLDVRLYEDVRRSEVETGCMITIEEIMNETLGIFHKMRNYFHIRMRGSKLERVDGHGATIKLTSYSLLGRALRTSLSISKLQSVLTAPRSKVKRGGERNHRSLRLEVLALIGTLS